MPYSCVIPGCKGEHASKHQLCDSPGKILFLDIDGVLNSRASYEEGRTKSAMRDPVDPLAVAQLQRIVDETGCRVVLSSSWRLGNMLADIRGMLIAAGARHPFPLVDKTPDLSRLDGRICQGARRGDEVKAWVGSCDSRNQQSD